MFSPKNSNTRLKKKQHEIDTVSSRKWKSSENLPFMLRSSYYSDAVIPKTDEDSTKQEKYGPISFMNIDTQIFHKILTNRIQQRIERIMHLTHWGLFQGYNI